MLQRRLYTRAQFDEHHSPGWILQASFWQLPPVRTQALRLNMNNTNQNLKMSTLKQKMPLTTLNVTPYASICSSQVHIAFCLLEQSTLLSKHCVGCHWDLGKCINQELLQMTPKWFFSGKRWEAAARLQAPLSLVAHSLFRNLERFHTRTPALYWSAFR